LVFPGLRVPTPIDSTAVFVLCSAILALSQLIYATIGFGAGLVAVSLLAMVLPDLADAVVILMVLTFATEVWVLAHHWRHVRGRLLLWLVPPMAVGLWFGTELLQAGTGVGLKRALGAVVAAAGLWFLWQERKAAGRGLLNSSNDSIHNKHANRWWSMPAGFASGLLGGLFGTGAPPVVMLFKGLRLPKATFRSTMLSYFLLMSVVRCGMYLQSGLLSRRLAIAAACLLPAGLIGIWLGMKLHHRIAEHQFGMIVSTLIVVLGFLLLVGIER
jgi:hypothetical protein